LSDVVLLDSSRDVGARNERRLLAVTCGKTSEFDVVHGLLNRVMQVLGIPYAGGWVPPTPGVCGWVGGGEG
jgi:phenylalanyl-tRNA synthetase beta chain